MIFKRTTSTKYQVLKWDLRHCENKHGIHCTRGKSHNKGFDSDLFLYTATWICGHNLYLTRAKKGRLAFWRHLQWFAAEDVCLDSGLIGPQKFTNLGQVMCGAGPSSARFCLQNLTLLGEKGSSQVTCLKHCQKSRFATITFFSRCSWAG